MVIALIGYGKMGKAVEKTALSKGHTVMIATRSQKEPIDLDVIQKAEVVIEFTRPDAAVTNLMLCLEHQKPVVCGTTGWQQDYNRVKDAFTNGNGSLFTASNFSVGMNLVFELNSMLSRWTSEIPGYMPSIREVHHLQKLDKPSGTAVTLANGICNNHSDYNDWKLMDGDEGVSDNLIPVYSFREENVIGLHEVNWISDIDKITLSHEAFTREGFAFGAVAAAEWLIGRKGVFEMRNMLFENKNKT